MLKKVFATVLLTVLAMTVAAQAPDKGSFSLMPKVGVVFSKFSNHQVFAEKGSFAKEYKAQFGPGFSVGLEGEYMAHPNIGVSLGLMYAHQGTDHELEPAEAGLDYLNVPLMANIYITPQLAFRIGAQVGFLVDNDSPEDDVYESVDFAIPLGLQFEYQNFMLGLRYNWGLTHVFKNSDYLKEKNCVFQIDLGYRIQL